MHSEFRIGQRALAENTFKAIKRGRGLMVQADTGIGKTVGTIFPALKAVPVEKLDKVFFLTAKAFDADILLTHGADLHMTLPIVERAGTYAPASTVRRVIRLSAELSNEGQFNLGTHTRTTRSGCPGVSEKTTSWS